MKKRGLTKALIRCLVDKKKTQEEILEIQNQRFKELLAHARNNSPYYQE